MRPIPGSSTLSPGWHDCGKHTPCSGVVGFSTDGPVERGDDGALPDIVWLRPDALPMTAGDWDGGFGRCIGVFLNGGGIPDCDEKGRHVEDDCFLMLFNSSDGA